MELEKIRANNERKEKDALSTLKDNRKGVKSYSRARYMYCRILII
jgi:hypothetical protein